MRVIACFLIGCFFAVNFVNCHDSSNETSSGSGESTTETSSGSGGGESSEHECPKFNVSVCIGDEPIVAPDFVPPQFKELFPLGVELICCVVIQYIEDEACNEFLSNPMEADYNVIDTCMDAVGPDACRNLNMDSNETVINDCKTAMEETLAGHNGQCRICPVFNASECGKKIVIPDNINEEYHTMFTLFHKLLCFVHDGRIESSDECKEVLEDGCDVEAFNTCVVEEAPDSCKTLLPSSEKEDFKKCEEELEEFLKLVEEGKA